MQQEIKIQSITGAMQPTITTERLILKELNPEIMHRLFTTCGDVEISAFLGLKTTVELETEKSNFRQGLSTYRTSFKNFLVVEKSSEKIIGRAGFHTWYTQHLRAEIGYSITDESARKKGYMKEALAAIINYGFVNMGLNRIEAFAGTGNLPSLLLLKGFGFVEEGLLRSHYCKDNKIEDSLCFSLLRSEYEKG